MRQNAERYITIHRRGEPCVRPLLLLLGVLLCIPVYAQDTEGTQAKRFHQGGDFSGGGGLQPADVPGLIGLAAVAEQYGDQNKADGYYQQALRILDGVQNLPDQNLVKTMQRFDKLIEEDQAPTAIALHGRIQQLVHIAPMMQRAQLTIGPDTDTVQHNDTTQPFISQGQAAFMNRDLLNAEIFLQKAFDFEKGMKSQSRSGRPDDVQIVSVADTAYKLAVVYYYEGKYDLAMQYLQGALNIYDQAYGQGSNPSIRVQIAMKEVQRSHDNMAKNAEANGL